MERQRELVKCLLDRQRVRQLEHSEDLVVVGLVEDLRPSDESLVVVLGVRHQTTG